MKKRIGYILCLYLLIMFLFTGSDSFFYKAGTVSEAARQKVIAVSTIGPTHLWAEGVLYYAQEEIKKVAQENGWKYVCMVGNDSNEQSEQIIELVAKKVDCIIMLPMDGASLKTAAIAVQKADIPLVIFDREIPDFVPAATLKGDNSGIGITTAKFLNNYFPKGTKVLEFMGDTSTVPSQRTDGYDETINQNFTKEQVGFTGWQRDEAKVLFDGWVEKNSQEAIDKVGAIFTHDDEIALGILDALDAYKADPSFKKTFKNLKVIAGSSGSQDMYKRILTEEKYYLFSLTYSPSMICDAVRIGEKIIKGEDYKEMTICSTVNVNKSNVVNFIDENSPF
ncbi:MAG: substrate-binding domain-containing protein [Ruminiclostridium sp.]